MKGVKSRILKKLNSIPQVTYLKQGHTLQVDASQGLWKPSPPPLQPENRILCDPPITREESIHGPTTMRAFNDENKENASPKPEKRGFQPEQAELSFQRPDPNSATLFDPNLLAAFRQAVTDHLRCLEKAKIKARTIREEVDTTKGEEQEPPSKIPRLIETYDPLIEFDKKCPPRGEESIVLYTTSLRGIRKTFEDCNSIRFLLESLKLVFAERDLSMHMEFREEVLRVLGRCALPPRLFIKGRYIGGANEVLGLHEQGRLLPLVEGMPRDLSAGAVCQGCGGMRFTVCGECNGSRKVFVNEERKRARCRWCNENGLVLCPLCC